MDEQETITNGVEAWHLSANSGAQLVAEMNKQLRAWAKEGQVRLIDSHVSFDPYEAVLVVKGRGKSTSDGSVTAI